ncbi:MAG: phosphatidylinositol mannoside acyltransferase [Actinobacteria bacterium]|nr:phosphatidylinositol mannoside acyltransferase [Actinomycetota bacterium]
MAPDPSYLGYRAASVVARLLPERTVGPASTVAGRVAARVMGGRAEMVARHQRRARPDLTDDELRAAVDRVFESYVHYWLESFRLPGTSVDVLDERLTHDGFQYLQDGLDRGNGVILAMPHLGAWEWAGFWLTTAKGVPTSVVVEQVEPPELAEWFTALRRELGMEIIPLDASAGTRASAALKANHVLCLLCDRDISGTGVEVEFFGERNTLPAGPATMALRSGAPLVPAAVYYDGDGHRAIARPPLDTTRQGKLRDDVARVSQALAHELEALILAHPEQWHLLQPNWPSDRAGHDHGAGS